MKLVENHFVVVVAVDVVAVVGGNGGDGVITIFFVSLFTTITTLWPEFKFYLMDFFSYDMVVGCVQVCEIIFLC